MMSHVRPTETGAVASLWRYPVKSMLGEALQAAQVGGDGLLDDRVYALLDRADGKAATAKNPRKWPNLFAYRPGIDGAPQEAFYGHIESSHAVRTAGRCL
jgi:uncharacterized protein YcbX